MSAIYSRRNSAQSYSSNIETGDSFQLYGRRFGNTYEASQIYDLLKLRVALLPGGKDSKQGPIIIFPSDSGIHRVSERDVIDCLIYLGSIPSEASAKKCFSIIIDNQKKTLSTQVNFILSCCQKSFDNAVSDIYIVEETPIPNPDLNGNLSSAKIHVVTKSQLQNSFNTRHLLPNLGGTLNYSHEKWLMFRKFIESYTKEAKSVCSELDMFAVHMSSNLFQATPSNLQNLWIDYMDVKRRAEEFVRKGDEFCISFKSPTFETFEEDEMIVLRRASSAVTEVEGKLSTLDVMWRRKDVEEQQKAGITSLEKEMNEVVDWILGPGDKLLISQTGIGRSYDSADELRKQHERLELKCLDSYGRYAELRHKVEAYAQYSMAEESKATELEAQRDYMDTVYRSFAKRLEQRRNTVIAAVKFHRLIDEISILLEEIRKRLNYKTDLDSVEELLDTLNALSEKLDFNHSMAMREGGLLKDMLCLPLKNAYGQDVNINREPDITYVENCLEKLQNDRENIRDALELKKLELQQFLQLKICEQNIEQAIAWIKELDGLINDPDSQNNQTLKDLERFQEELGKGENTAKNSFDYGQELLKAALYLRRALGLDMEPNSDQANRLNGAWRNFSRGSNENAARRTAIAIFDKKSDEFLKATENLLANLDVSAPQSYEEEKRNLDQHHRELQMTADGLNERIQRPILFEQNNRNQPNMDNLQVAENIKIKIQRMNDRMDQLNRKWSSLSKNGYVAGQRGAYEGSDSSGNSQSRGIEPRSMGTRREVYDSNRELNGLVRPAPQNQLNDWLESHALRRITSTNNMGSTLESVEDFYEKHVESLQDMKAQEHVHVKAGLNKNLPQQWNVVQEIIKQRITLALSLIKFHLSFNKASEDLERVERWIDRKSDVNISGALTELEENEDTMTRNAAEFLNSASNQIHKDEYLNVDQPKYFVRDIMDQWKQRKGQVERGLLARSMEDLLHEANSINEELNNLENDFLKSPSAPSRNIAEFNNRMEDLSKRISSLEDYYNLEQKSPFINPSHSSEVQSKLEDLRLKCSNIKRLFQQSSRVDTFKKDVPTSENLPQSEFYVVRPLQDAVAKKGESLKLSCHVNASPSQKIRVKWLKDGSVLNCSGVKYDSQYKDGRCDLTISDVSQEDSGRYSCIAADGQVAISTADVLVEAAPSIKEPLRDKIIKEGEPVEFSIKVAGNPIPTVQWFLNGKELSNSPDFQIFSKDDVHTLRISEVFDEDKGLYSVLAKNKYGETTDRARLKVSVSPSADDSTSKHVRSSNWNPSPASNFNASAQPSFKNVTPFESRPNSGFLKPLVDKTSEAGEDIILECNLPLFPVPSKITWYKDGIEITRTMPGIRTSLQQGICRLVIERADTSHSGKYVCKAQLKENLYETSMLLTVRDKLPMMLPDSKYSPSVTLDTKKTDAPSKFDTSFQVAPFESSLRSQDFQGKSTDGDLGFSVRNSAAPQFVKKLESGLLVENSSTTFSCKVTGEPAPNIQWYHNGRLIRPSNKYRMKLNKDGECSLMVTDCNKQDAGFYTCCALNVTGRDVCSAELTSEGANDIDTTSYVEPDALKRMLRPKSSTKTEEVYSGVVESLSEPSFAKSCVTQVTVDEGETARIECKVYGHPSPDLSWYKNGKEVRRGGRFQVVTNQEGMQSLVIKLVQCSDAGVYTCRAHNKSGQATMDFTLQVEDVSSKYQSKIYLSRNAPSVKQAEVVPPPQSPPGYTPLSKVFSDSTKLKMSSKQAEVQRNVENELSLQRLPPVRNNSSPKPLDHFPPRFLVTPDPVTANEGGYAKFWAKVSANPPATVTWFINGHEIFTSSRFNVYFDGLMHVLEIMKVKNFDDGEVKVAARNYKGDVHHAAQLSVADAISLRTHLHPSTDALQSKKRSLPSIEITSTKDESFKPPIKTEGRSISIKTKSDAPSCPLFLEKLCESVKAKDGEEVVLTCVVVGNPAPEVSWLKNGKPVSIYEDYATTYDWNLGIARLVISDCLPGDCGRFACVAKNVLGQSRTECLLSLENSFTKAKSEDPTKNKPGRVMSFKVLKELLRSDATVPQSDKDKNQYAAPSFTKQLSDGEVNDGDQVILSACFEGSPFPSISWLFNDKPIQPNSDFLVTVDAYKKETSLKIVEVFPEDNGIYSCKATNILGVATTSCNLIVKYDKTATTTDVVSGVEVKEERKFSETISLSGSSTPVQFSTPPITKNSEIHFRNSPVFKGMTIEMEIPEVISQKEIQLRRKGEAVGTVRHELQVSVEAKEIEKGQDLILNPLKTPDPVRKKRRAQAVQSKSLVIEKSIPVFVEPLEQIVNQSRGKLFEMKCQLFSATPATIEWYHKNELLTDELTVRSSFDPKSGLVVLRFPNVQQRHAGPYRCVAKNPHGSASCETELFIKDETLVQPSPPHSDIIDQMMPKTPEMTDHKPPSVTTIAKVCFASIEELKQIEAEKQINMENMEDTIGPQDKTAVAKTSVVEKESAYLLETFKQHKVLPCTETIHLSECKEQTLLCRISPVSPKMSVYLKTLRHAAIKNLLEIVDHSEALVLPLNPVPLEELTLETHFPMCDPCTLTEATPASVVTSQAFEKDETSSDEDIFYDCMEFDEKGRQAEHLVTSSVKDKETFLNITGHPPQTMEVLEGQSFVLECHFEGLPSPKAIWFKNDLEIKNNERTTIENYDSKSILTVDSALALDDSIYSCRVQNQFHSAETLTHVLMECASYSGFVKKDVPSDSTKEIEQETVKLPLKDVKKTCPENGELKGKESYVSSYGIDFKDQTSESSFDSARFKKDLKSPDPPSSLRDSLNQEIIWRGKADKEKLKPDVPREVGAKEFKDLDKSSFQSSDNKLKTSEIKSYTRFGTDDKSRKVSDEVDYKSVENQDTKDGATHTFDGSGQNADEKQETLSKKVRTEVKEFTTSTHTDILQDSQTERSRTTAKDDIRNKSPEEFSLGKKIKSSEADGSRSQNESSFFQKSMKSTTTTETTEYKWKKFLEGSEEDSESNIGETDKGSPSLESSETFYRKEESDRKSIEESRQKLHLKSEMNQRSEDLMPKDTVYSKTKYGRAKEDDKKDYKIESSLDTGDKSHLKNVHVDIKYKATVSDDVDHVKPRIKEDNLRGVDAEDVGGPVAGISKYEATEEQKDAPQDGEDEPISSTSEEERAREQKYISTLTEEITFKDVNNVPQKFSTRLLKTVEYTKTNSIKSSTKDMPDLVEEDSRSKPPYVRHAMSEFQWNIQDSEDQRNLHDIGDQYKKWREDASVEISDNNHQIYNQDSQPVPNQNEYSLNEYGEYYTSNSIRNEKNPENVKYLSSYIDKASGNHLEISNKGVQYDSNGKIATREVVFREPIEKSVTIQDVETTDEITVETKVTQVKTVSMQLSETGDINLTETTQVQTDTDMKETKKTREREELVVSHLVSNVTEVLDQGDPNASNVSLQDEQNAEAVSEKYDLFSTWNIEPGVLIAVHSYEPDSDEVMSLHEGERLEFLEENSEDWWFVRKFFDNRQGFVPSRLLQTKEDFDKNVSDKIAQQIDRLEDSLTTKLEDYGQESPPHMVNLLEDVSVRDGESATFKCLVSGNPKPSVTWFHNSKIVKPSPDFLQFYDPDCVCSLSIREVFPEDGGRYTMIAKNLFGIASSSAELLVVENEYIREKEETKVSGCPILVVQPKHLVLDEGSTAKFMCKFKGKFPMKVTWYKDGRQVSPGDKTKFDVTEEDGEFITVELTLESADESHMGKYRVLVSNDLGETEALTSLVINTLPKAIDFKANLKKSSREPDTNVTFKQERVLEEKSQRERLHSHTEANSSFGSSEVIQHDFRNVLKPSSSTNTRY